MINQQVKLPTITRVILTPSPKQIFEKNTLDLDDFLSDRSNSARLYLGARGQSTNRVQQAEQTQEEQLEDVLRVKMKSSQRGNAKLLSEFVNRSKSPNSIQRTNQNQSQNMNISRDISHLLDGIVKQKKDAILVAFMKNQPVNPNNSQGEEQYVKEAYQQKKRRCETKQSQRETHKTKEETTEESSLSKITYNLNLVKDSSKKQTANIQNEIQSLIQAIPEDKFSLQKAQEHQYQCESLIKPKILNN